MPRCFRLAGVFPHGLQCILGLQIIKSRSMSNFGSEPSQNTPSPGEQLPSALFAGPAPEPSNRGKLALIAAVVVAVLIVAGALLVRADRSRNAVAPIAVRQADPYAKDLVFSQLAMSQSTSLSGGTSTFIDGHVKNAGPATLTGITMQVLFRNDVNLAPQVETLPLTLIRTHEPYVDTEPVSAAPLKPGDEAEFRLIFESVTGSWNQQMPDILAVGVSKR